jgi:hypothetical protein
MNLKGVLPRLVHSRSRGTHRRCGLPSALAWLSGRCTRIRPEFIPAPIRYLDWRIPSETQARVELA